MKHFFKCLCEFPEDHIIQISLFICVGTPSKGSQRFVSLVLPFLSWTHNFSVVKDAFLLLIIRFTLWFVMSAPLWSLWSHLKKNRWWAFPLKCLKASTRIFASYQQLSCRKYIWAAGWGSSIMCSTSERSNQQTNSRVLESPTPFLSDNMKHVARISHPQAVFGFWNMLPWLIAAGIMQGSLTLKQQLWADPEEPEPPMWLNAGWVGHARGLSPAPCRQPWCVSGVLLCPGLGASSQDGCPLGRTHTREA